MAIPFAMLEIARLEFQRNWTTSGKTFNDFQKIFQAKNPCECKQITSNQITGSINALNQFHF